MSGNCKQRNKYFICELNETCVAIFDKRLTFVTMIFILWNFSSYFGQPCQHQRISASSSKNSCTISGLQVPLALQSVWNAGRRVASQSVQKLESLCRCFLLRQWCLSWLRYAINNNNIFIQPAPSGGVFIPFADQQIAFILEIRKLIILGHNQYIIQNKHPAILNLCYISQLLHVSTPRVLF